VWPAWRAIFELAGFGAAGDPGERSLIGAEP
jgi:hypothetical protein